jgi:hypothetical protein
MTVSRVLGFAVLLFIALVAAGSCGFAREGVPLAGAVAKPAGEQAPASPAQPLVTTPATRRVIHKAEIWLESDAPDAAREQLASMAARAGGFVLSAETSRNQEAAGAEWVEVVVVFRVPALQFDAVLAQVRGLGTRVSNEKVTGQDVTEEYVDVEARLKAQRAVEEQFLAVLKEAKNVHDILEVQQKLGETRTEIERAEGRRRYLEDQTSLSTVTVHLAKHIDAVEAGGPGFGRSIRAAGRDVVDVAVAIVNGVIRLVGVLIPIGVLVGLPAYGVFRLLRRRKRAGAPKT